VFDKLHCSLHLRQTPVKTAPASFRVPETVLGISALHPRSNTFGLGSQIRLDRCLQFSLTAAAVTILHSKIHAVSANQPPNSCRFPLLARAFGQFPLATNCSCQHCRVPALPLPSQLRSNEPCPVRGRLHTTSGQLSDVSRLPLCDSPTYNTSCLRISTSCNVSPGLFIAVVCLAPALPHNAARQHYASVSNGTRSHVTFRFGSNRGIPPPIFALQSVSSLPTGDSA
jgi:hypothetical protein